MVKLELHKQMREFKDFDDESEGDSVEHEGGRMSDSYLNENQNDIIRVFNYDANHPKDMSITTPRNELQNSAEKQAKVVGQKTIKEHTFEDQNLSQSSINSLFFSKESLSNEEPKSNSGYSSNGIQSNEKRSVEQSDLSARHYDGSRINSDRSQSNHSNFNRKEKGVIQVIGKDQNRVLLPKISLGKGSKFDKSKEMVLDQYEINQKSNRSGSSRNENDRVSDKFIKNIADPSISRNCINDTPYSNKFQSEDSKKNDNDKKDCDNSKIGGKDLEVIKENHSEFSNSNSVIETFRNKRKSNISSSGNNSGDQHNVHAAQEMINEEDEDIENDTTSFRGPKKLTIYDSDHLDNPPPRIEYSNKYNKDSKGLNFFKSKPFGSNRNRDQEMGPCDNPIFNRPVNLHEIEMKSKFMRSSSLSPNTRLLRSFSSEIPSYILQYKEKICLENEEESMIYVQESDFAMKDSKLSPKHDNVNIKDLSSEVDWNKNRYDKEITNEGSQLMKSPSMGSIHMEDNKEKTAEFEREDLQPKQESIKLTNRPMYFGKNNFLSQGNASKEENKI
jgi:hypothetical protein